MSPCSTSRSVRQRSTAKVNGAVKCSKRVHSQKLFNVLFVTVAVCSNFWPTLVPSIQYNNLTINPNPVITVRTLPSEIYVRLILRSEIPHSTPHSAFKRFYGSHNIKRLVVTIENVQRLLRGTCITFINVIHANLSLCMVNV